MYIYSGLGIVEICAGHESPSRIDTQLAMLLLIESKLYPPY